MSEFISKSNDPLTEAPEIINGKEKIGLEKDIFKIKSE